MWFNWGKTAKVVILLLVVVAICFLVFRNALLRHYTDKYVSAYSSLYKTAIQVNQCEFVGFKTIAVSGICISPSQTDSLLYISDIKASVSLWGLLKGLMRFTNLEIENASLHIIKKSENNNFSFLMKNKAKEKQDTLFVSNTSDYASLANSIINTVFDVIPSSVQFKNISVQLNTDSLSVRLHTPELIIDEDNFQAQFTSEEDSLKNTWQAQGIINKDNNTAQLKLFSKDNDVMFPLLKNKYKLSMSCDTTFLSLAASDFSNGVLTLTGNARLNNLQANHWRISPKNVVIKECAVNYSVSIGSNYFQIDSATSVRLNSIDIYPFVNYILSPSQQLSLKVRIPESNAQDFFESLPTGLFANLEGIKTQGNLAYQLYFSIDSDLPDSLKFSSVLSKKDFKVLDYGNTDLRKINGDFLYTAYEKEKAVRAFSVGASNPNYAPLDNISNFLKNAIMTSEDGNFYGHSGFNENMFRKSIAENYKQKRFVRGGSTISMQLVKNVFLLRNKTIARKVEEALIVWLIESNRLVSKSRMYEVYLNIIELGPNVYGVGEAARFYFNKQASQLTLEESIFIAMIVPRPKRFKYNFDEQGKLKPSTADFYNVIAGHFVKRGLITEDERAVLLPEIELAGIARNYIIKKDTTLLKEEKQLDVPDGYEY